jgi:hypothetical protein
MVPYPPHQRVHGYADRARTCLGEQVVRHGRERAVSVRGVVVQDRGPDAALTSEHSENTLERRRHTRGCRR